MGELKSTKIDVLIVKELRVKAMILLFNTKKIFQRATVNLSEEKFIEYI